KVDPFWMLKVDCVVDGNLVFPPLGPDVENSNLLGKKKVAIKLVDCCAARCSEGYVVETDTFSMIALGEEPLGTLGNDYSGSLLLPFYHSLHLQNLGKAESA